MSVKEIKNAISQLPPQEISELMTWLENYCAELWDKQIEHDLAAGRLGHVLAKVDEDIAAGLATPIS